MSQNQQSPNTQSQNFNIEDGIRKLIEYAKTDQKNFPSVLGDNEEAFEQFCRANLKQDFRDDSNNREKIFFLGGYKEIIKKYTVKELIALGISEENANRLKSNYKSKYIIYLYR